MGGVVRYCIQQRAHGFHLAMFTARTSPAKLENATPNGALQQDSRSRGDASWIGIFFVSRRIEAGVTI
jgi:hypothetical protein